MEDIEAPKKGYIYGSRGSSHVFGLKIYRV